MKNDTLIVSAGRRPDANHGLPNPPVYHASTVAFPTVAALEAARDERLNTVYYGRYGTPTTFAFEEAVAALEGGHRTVTAPSGLAAIACALLSFLKAGDHLLMVDSAYFPTRHLCGGLLAGLGVETTYYDPMIGAAIAELMRPETKVVYTESPCSLTFEVQDIPAIAAAAHTAGAVVLMDNTWSGGLYFQPFAHGVDVSIQSATKYIGGHSDVMLGAITTTEETYETVKWTAIALGTCAGPDDCYLGLRGLRSLSARLARHQENGLALAGWLADRPEVRRVLHPALPGASGHDTWKRDFSGASGLFGIVLGDYSKQAVAAMLDGLEHYAMGFSWGGVESLILPIDPASARSTVPWTESGACLRIHAGIEDAGDLIADLEKGLARLTAAA